MTAVSEKHSLFEIRSDLESAAAIGHEKLRPLIERVDGWRISNSTLEIEDPCVTYLICCMFDPGGIDYQKIIRDTFESLEGRKICEQWAKIIGAKTDAEKKSEKKSDTEMISLKIEIVWRENLVVGNQEHSLHRGIQTVIQCASPLTPKILKESIASAANVKVDDVIIGVLGKTDPRMIYYWKLNDWDSQDVFETHRERPSLFPKVFINKKKPS